MGKESFFFFFLFVLAFHFDSFEANLQIFESQVFFLNHNMHLPQAKMDKTQSSPV